MRFRAVQPWVVVFGHRQMYYGIVSTHSSKMMRLGMQKQGEGGRGKGEGGERKGEAR